MLTQVDLDGSTVRTITSLTQIDADGTTVRSLKTLYQNDATGTPRLVWSASGSGSNALTPNEVDGYGYSKTPIAVTTDQATVDAPTGATITWNFTGTGWSAVSPGQATSSFRKTVSAGTMATTQVTATIVSGGVTTTTNAILATVTNEFAN